MNASIRQYFDTIEARLIQSPAVTSYQIRRREVGPTDGKIRIEVLFHDNSSAEFFEYVIAEGTDVLPRKYSFHWQDSAGNLKRRWDNAPHYPSFSLPDHVHAEDGSVQQMNERISLLNILQQIEEALGRV